MFGILSGSILRRGTTIRAGTGLTLTEDSDGLPELQVTAGGGLPSGTSGELLLYNGSAWVGTKTLTAAYVFNYGSGTAISITSGAGVTARMELRGNGLGANSGLLLESDIAGNAYVWQYANLPMYLGTNNVVRLTLAASGDATFSGAVSMGALTASTGAFSGTITLTTNATMLRGKTSGGATVNLFNLTADTNNITRFLAGVDAGGFQWTDQAASVAWMTLNSTGLLVATTLQVYMAAAYARITSTTGTNSAYLQFDNSAGGYYVGADNSTGSSLGGGAYALTLYAPSTRDIVLRPNAATALTLRGSDGAAVFAHEIYAAEVFATKFGPKVAAADFIVRNYGGTTLLSITDGGVATLAGARPITLNQTSGLISLKGETGGWSMSYGFLGSSGTVRGGFGASGSSDTLNYWYIGTAYDNATAVLHASAANVSGNYPRLAVTYDGGFVNYFGALSWNELRLGNNGVNYIIAGRTATGGTLAFYTNNVGTTLDGNLALTLQTTGVATFAKDITVASLGTFDSTAAPTLDYLLGYNGTKWVPRLVQLAFNSSAVSASTLGDGTAASYAYVAPTYSGTPAAPSTPTLVPVYKGIIINMGSAPPAGSNYVIDYSTNGGGYTTNAIVSTGSKVVHSGLTLTSTYAYKVRLQYGASSYTSYSSATSATSPSAVTEVNAYGLVLASQVATAELSSIVANIGTITAGKLQNAGNTAGVLLTGSLPGGWTTYLNLTATGANPLLYHSKLSLNADGSALFYGGLDMVGGQVSQTVQTGHMVLRQASLTHGMTSLVQTDVLAVMGHVYGATSSTEGGGFVLYAFANQQTGNPGPACLIHTHTLTPGTAFGHGPQGGFSVEAWKKSGTTRTELTGNELIATFRAGSSTRMAVNADGDLALLDATTGAPYFGGTDGIYLQFSAAGSAFYREVHCQQYNIGSKGSNFTVDWRNGNSQRVTLTGSVTITLSNGKAGGVYTLLIEQGGSGSYTVTWAGSSASVIWSGGTAPTLTTTVGRADMVSFYFDDVPSTDKYLGFVSGYDFAV